MKELVAYLSVILLFVVFSLGVTLFAASQEAKAFYQITGKKVSTWDAFWVELRVDAC